MEQKENKVSLDLIDDPKIAMRSELDDEKMDELVRSMDTHGLIEPVVLRAVGDRYEVIAGHRRTRAARLLGWPHIEAKVVVADDKKALALRLAENSDRSDVNPADEAAFIGEIMLKHSISAEQVAEMMNRSVEWVKTRIEVFNCPFYIQEHLRLGKYSLGAALWISRIEREQDKQVYANWAALNGVSVAGARKWCLDLKARNPDLGVQVSEIQDEGGSFQPVRVSVRCEKCAEQVFLDEAINVWIHRSCPSEHVTPPVAS